MSDQEILSREKDSPGLFFIAGGLVTLQCVDGIQSTYRKIMKVESQSKIKKESLKVDIVSLLDLEKGSYFGEDFLLSKRPLFRYVNKGPNPLRVYFIRGKDVLAYLEKDSHGFKTWSHLEAITERRRAFYSSVIMKYKTSQDSLALLLQGIVHGVQQKLKEEAIQRATKIKRRIDKIKTLAPCANTPGAKLGYILRKNTRKELTMKIQEYDDDQTIDSLRVETEDTISIPQEMHKGAYQFMTKNSLLIKTGASQFNLRRLSKDIILGNIVDGIVGNSLKSSRFIQHLAKEEKMKNILNGISEMTLRAQNAPLEEEVLIEERPQDDLNDSRDVPTWFFEFEGFEGVQIDLKTQELAKKAASVERRIDEIAMRTVRTIYDVEFLLLNKKKDKEDTSHNQKSSMISSICH